MVQRTQMPQQMWRNTISQRSMCGGILLAEVACACELRVEPSCFD